MYDAAIKEMAKFATRHVFDGFVVGLGSGRAAAAMTRALARMMDEKPTSFVCVPTSLQAKILAEELRMAAVSADQVSHIDVAFDGADQIDRDRYVIKGGGGALLRENIVFGLARLVVVLADRSKFARTLSRPVPVEVHPLARELAAQGIEKLGGEPEVRVQDDGYPFFTENGNIILDCDFGKITEPVPLSNKIRRIPGVLEAGIFTRRPDIIYKAKAGGYEIIRSKGMAQRDSLWTPRGVRAP